MNPTRFLACLLALCGTLHAGVASAQIERARVVREGQGTFSAAATRRLGRASVLSSFRLEFLNGDHKINTIRILPIGGQASIGFADKDGNDPISVDATWLTIPGASNGVWAIDPWVEYRGGEISSALPQRNANTTLAIAGFEAVLRPGHDCHVEQVAIGFSPDQRSINVDFGKGCSQVPFVRVLYSEIPNQLIRSSGSLTGAERDRASGRRPRGPHVISGFKFKFNNGGHFLQSFGIHLRGADLISWQDQNLDDPIEYRVDWIELR